MAYYPPASFHFSVDFSGISDKADDTRFQSVGGLNMELNTEDYKEGGENRFVHVLPVKTKYPRLVLKRGMLLDSKVVDWCLETMNTLVVKPIDMGVSLLNENHEPLMSWNIVHAWPVKWDIGEFNAEQSSLVIETLELTYHYFNVVK
ncbi:MAG: phage tail protein [Bacteroidota bacterium]